MTSVANILWAEDTLSHFEDCSATLRTFLEEHGISSKITNTVDGGEVFKYLLESKFDLLLLDLNMRRFHGLDVLPEIHRRWPGLPIIVISEHANDEHLVPDLEKAVRDGLLRSFYPVEPRKGFCLAVLTALVRMDNVILHLSDLHFGSGHAFHGVSAEELLAHALPEMRRLGDPTLLVLSGDFACAGEETEFARARRFIINLCADLHLPVDRVIIVPGNHDIAWKAGNDADKFSNYVDFLISLYSESDNPTLAYARYPELFDSGKRLLLADARRRGGDALYSLATYDSLRLTVVGLNSVVATEGEYDLGRISPHQLLGLTKMVENLQMPQSGYFRIAVFHHNLFMVPSFRSDGQPHRLVRNAALILHHLIESGIKLVLHGHTHYSIAHEYRPVFLDIGGAQTCGTKIVATGTFGAEEREPSQAYSHATIIQPKIAIDGDVDRIVVTPFKLTDERLRWERGDSITLSTR